MAERRLLIIIAYRDSPPPPNEVAMRLKRLELYGYKSFAARAQFEFSEGITAIVGPNGSGKSNIADAIRWVLGEHSFGTLRAKTSEDMIFAGTRQRSRMGVAEVLLVLDNSDGWLPLEYSEVVLGRRAFRSGENEYLLNGNRVRYRDIVDIVEGSLLRSGYTVIGQGLVDAVLSLRPEARRTLFEEAAGVAPHLRKRAEALRRIEETERNLQRVNDIIGELGPRAQTLRRQAERAEEHLLLTQDLQELQRVWFGHQWQHRQQVLDRAEAVLKELAGRVDAQRAYAQSFQEKQDRLTEAQATQRRALEAITKEQAQLRDATESLRREQAVALERERLLHAQHEALGAELATLASRSEIVQGEVEHTRAELATHDAALASDRAALEAARGDLHKLQSARQAVEQHAAAEQNRLNKIQSAIAETNARLEQLAERRDSLISERDDARAAMALLEAGVESMREQGEQLAGRERALVQYQQRWQEQLTALEAEVTATREQLAASEETARRIHHERDRLTERLDLLSRLRQELTGYHPGVREVLGASEGRGHRQGEGGGSAGLPGLLGTVASLMAVPKEFEQAIESALGARLQNIVTERWEHAEAAIEHLKRTRAGWATFLPLDTVRSRSPLSLRPEPGVLGVASSLVHYEERLRPVFELLLGSIVIVRDLATARRLLSRRLGASQFVTLAGETVQPSGALSGGTRRDRGNLLAQEREWRDLPDRITEVEAQLAEALQHCEAQREALQNAQRQVKEQTRLLARLRVEIDSAHSAVGNHAQEIRERERELRWRERRIAQIGEELDELADRERALTERLAEAQREQEEASARLSALRRQLSGEGYEGLAQQVAELETRVAVAQRTVRSGQTLLESHQANLAQIQSQIEAKQQQRAAIEQDLARLASSIETARARLEELEQSAASVEARLQPAREEIAQLERQRRDLDRQRTQALELLNRAEAEYNRGVLERDRARDELQALARDIEEDLGPIELPATASPQLRLSLGDDVIELPVVTSVPASLDEDIRQLRARIRRLGSINPNAPQEYEQLMERQTFLHSQAADLRGAIAGLHEVIEELDGVIERDLGTTIRTVNRSFREYFATLFKGGSAELVVTDPDSITTTGIDIIAHPPGKRAQSLSLLSGGERALTAVALLFALLRANPVPFCFLDEVDAALDEANVGRFRDMLREHARHTQFVVITHNRRTIEAASTVYGISMGEQGISQCISLRLDEAVQAAGKDDHELAAAGS